jgi:hypothetical protein
MVKILLTNEYLCDKYNEVVSNSKFVAGNLFIFSEGVQKKKKKFELHDWTVRYKPGNEHPLCGVSMDRKSNKLK